MHHGNSHKQRYFGPNPQSSETDLPAKQEEEYKDLHEGPATENAKNLTSEQMLALELDILKPLDFYEILLNRMKANDDNTAVNGPQTGHDL